MKPLTHSFIALIRVYQWTVSPLLRLVGGAGCGCRFAPSCSHYAAESLRRYGLIDGGWLALRRLGRCHPFGGSGADPVPERPSRFLPEGLTGKKRKPSDLMSQSAPPFTAQPHSSLHGS